MSTLSFSTVVPLLTLDTIADWYRLRADGMYGGEAVTQLEHALQCATLAQKEDAHPELIAAAFLHDIGHLVEDMIDINDPHERIAVNLLCNLFNDAVTEPIRMHVEAKRYLCAIDPLHWTTLSEMSKRSLIWQGGPFTAPEAMAFISQPHADEAVRLRQWDDAAKVSGAETPSLDAFLKIIWRVALPAKIQAGELA
jgi:phosphonate degradation associated HDIG domain protein